MTKVKILTYDGSFLGLFTAIYTAYYLKQEVEIFKVKDEIPGLISPTVMIETDEFKANKVFRALEQKVGKIIMDNIYFVFLSDFNYSSSLIYSYVRLCFKYGREVALHLELPEVLTFERTRNKVLGEAHRMTGFIRFKKLGEILYAQIEPDHNILELVLDHFSSRLGSEKWIIHDKKRSIALIYNGKESRFVTVENEPISNLQNLDIYESLWKKYYDSTSIKERINERYKLRSMPKRYHKNMLETE
ncbi:MAG TPA: TIGR03915 family putative DNA repair protein [Clostridiaceae bacterium]